MAVRLHRRLAKEHPGDYFVFCDGAFKGAAESLEAAAGMVRASGRPKGLIAKVGEDLPLGGDWLWSSLELFAAWSTGRWNPRCP